MDAFIATILPAGFDFNPYGWQLCWGQQLPLNQYQALFALVSTKYGGDGVNTFNLPDLRGRVPIGYGVKDGALNYAIGTKYGNDAQTISSAQLPPHTHAATFAPVKANVTAQTTAVTGNQNVSAKVDVSASTATSGPTNDAYLAAPSSATLRIYSSTTSNSVSLGGVSATLDGSPSIPALSLTVPDVVVGGSVAVSVTGGGFPIDIRPSSQAINFIICINGIFPTRA